MKMAIVFCGKEVGNKSLDDLQKPVQISFNKEEGIEIDPTVTLKGPESGVYAGTCAIVTSVIKDLHPDNKRMQKAVLDLLYASISGDLGLNITEKPRTYGPISPDDVDF